MPAHTMGAIVVGTDGSPAAEAAVRRAAELASRDGSRVHVVAAYPDPGFFHEQYETSARRAHVGLRDVAETVLQRAARRVEEVGVPYDLDAREGEPATVLIDVAREQGADLIVVGDKGDRGAGRFLLGGVASKLSHHAPVSVLIVRPT